MVSRFLINMSPRLAIVCTISFGVTVFADNIKGDMSEQDLLFSGLSKLTEKEVEYLGAWIDEKYSCDSIDESHIDSGVEELHRTIDGGFSGWSGKTLFKMDNGEIWQQRVGGRYYKKLNSPSVVITKNSLGLYVMEVIDTKRKVGVKKIK